MGLVLVAVVLGSIEMAAPAAAHGCVGADVKPAGPGLTAASTTTLCLVNVERAKHGLKRLKPSGELKRAARGHSRDMVAHQYFDHVSPGGSTVLTRVRKTGYLKGYPNFVVRENIGWGAGEHATPRENVAAWMASSEHRANILNPKLRDGGVGIASGSPFGGPGATYTLVFGARRR